MATFSQGFLSSLGRPAMGESLFGLGQAIGGIPGQMRERSIRQELAQFDPTTSEGQLGMLQAQLARETDPQKRLELGEQIRQGRQEQQSLSSFDILNKLSQQAVAAAQEGNITSLDGVIQSLTKQLESAETLEQKRLISRLVSDAQSLRGGAKETGITNNANKMIRLDQQIEALPPGDPKRVVLQTERDNLGTDPETARQYQQRKMAFWNFKKTEEDLQAEKYLNSVRPQIEQAISEGNIDNVNSIIAEAPEFVGEELRDFVDAAMRNQETKAVFQERNAERTKEPNVELYRKQIEALPEDFRKILIPVLDQYEKASKAWKGGQWVNVGSRLAAANLEKTLQNKITDAQGREAVASFTESRTVRRGFERNLAEAQLALEQASILTPQEERNAVLNAKSVTANKKGRVTEEEVEEQRQKIIKSKRDTALANISYYRSKLTGEEPAEEENSFVMVNGIKTTPAMVREGINQQGEKAIIKKLKDNGVSETDIEFLIGKKLEEKPRELSAIEKRIEKQKQRFTEALGTREERMQALGSR